MKDNFVHFPHSTCSDVMKQHSGPTTDTHTHTHKHTSNMTLKDGNQSGCEPQNSDILGGAPPFPPGDVS